eukprot:scaffold125896_cov33-Phaeocystis_antarctica.AAC.1
MVAPAPTVQPRAMARVLVACVTSVQPEAVAVELRKEDAVVATGRDDALEPRALGLEVGL